MSSDAFRISADDSGVSEVSANDWGDFSEGAEFRCGGSVIVIAEI